MLNIKRYVFSSLLFVIIINLILLKGSETARILAVFPTPSISHQVVFRPLTQELARRGHEVVVITTDPAFPKEKAPVNLTEIDVHNISYNIWKDVIPQLSATAGKVDDILKQFDIITTGISKAFEAQIQSDEVQKLIQNKEEKFDLILAELVVRPALVFSYIFKAPLIHVSSFGPFYDTYELMGTPTHPTLYPPFLRLKLNNITYWDKLKTIFVYVIFKHILKHYDLKDDEMLRSHFGKNTPTISELTKKIEMVFLNVHPMWEGNYAVPPTVVHMWGIHTRTVKELPQDLKFHLDSAKNGVIYMSFGTNIDPARLSPEILRIFFKVLSESSYEVLWKWNMDEVPGRAKNIRYSKWFPQSDLLRHQNVKLFITQGGLQSTDEAITAGVPVIGIPLLGDQYYNVEKYVLHGIGVRLDLEAITEDSLRKAIETVVEDGRYKQNILKLRSQMQDQPMSPLDRAAFWAEHVIRHSGAAHLRSPAAHISWREYLELDLLLIALGTFLLVSIMFIWIGYRVIKFLYQILYHMILNRKKMKEN